MEKRESSCIDVRMYTDTTTMEDSMDTPQNSCGTYIQRLLLSHKKEHIWVNSIEVDETGVYYTE